MYWGYLVSLSTILTKASLSMLLLVSTARSPERRTLGTLEAKGETGWPSHEEEDLVGEAFTMVLVTRLRLPRQSRLA